MSGASSHVRAPRVRRGRVARNLSLGQHLALVAFWLRLRFGCGSLAGMERRSSPWAGEQPPERAAALVVAERPPAWVEQFIEALDRRLSAESLGRLLASWGLSQTD